MPITVQVEGVGNVSFPDDATPEEISQALNAAFPAPAPAAPLPSAESLGYVDSAPPALPGTNSRSLSDVSGGIRFEDENPVARLAMDASRHFGGSIEGIGQSLRALGPLAKRGAARETAGIARLFGFDEYADDLLARADASFQEESAVNRERPLPADPVVAAANTAADSYKESTNPNLDNTPYGKLVSGFGSVVATTPTRVAAPIMAAGMMANEGRQDAVAHGATPEQVDIAGLAQGVGGALLERGLGAGKMLDDLMLGGSIASMFAKQGARGAAEEAAQQALLNVTANTALGYDPTRSTGEGVGESAAYGALVQAPVGAGFQAAANSDLAKLEKIAEAAVEEEVNPAQPPVGLKNAVQPKVKLEPVRPSVKLDPTLPSDAPVLGMDQVPSVSLRGKQYASPYPTGEEVGPPPPPQGPPAAPSYQGPPEGPEQGPPLPPQLGPDPALQGPPTEPQGPPRPTPENTPDAVSEESVPAIAYARSQVIQGMIDNGTATTAQKRQKNIIDAQLKQERTPRVIQNLAAVTGLKVDPQQTGVPPKYQPLIDAYPQQTEESPRDRNTREAMEKNPELFDPETEIGAQAQAQPVNDPSTLFPEGAAQEGADTLADRIRAAADSIDVSGVHDVTIGLPKAAAKGALLVAEKVVRGGGSIAEAVNMTVDWARENHPGETVDTEALTDYLTGLNVNPDKEADEPLNGALDPAEEYAQDREPVTNLNENVRKHGDALKLGENVSALKDKIGIKEGDSAAKVAGKVAIAPAKAVKAAAEYLVDSAVTHWSRAQKQYNSNGIKRLLGIFHDDAGSGELGSGPNVHQRVFREEGRFLNKMGDIVAKLDPVLARLESERKAAPDLTRRKLLERIGQYITEPDGTGPGGTVGEVVSDFRKLYKELLEYQKAAGVEIGDQGDTYFGRNIDIDAVQAHPDKFVRQAAKAYRDTGLDQEAAMEAARAYQAALLLSEAGARPGEGLFDNMDSGSASNHTKARVLPASADQHLKDFYHRDAVEATAAYIRGAVKKAERVRMFGKVDSKGKMDQWGKWKEIRQQMVDEGVPPKVINRIAEEVRNSFVGLRNASDAGRNIVSGLTAYSTLRYLTYSTLSATVEPIFVAGRLDYGPLKGLQKSGEALVRTLRTMVEGAKSQDEALRMVKGLGFVSEILGESHAAMRVASPEAYGKLSQTLVSSFLRRVGLPQITDATRITAAKMGMVRLWEFADMLESGTPKQKRQAGEFYRELGIKDADHASFAEFMRQRFASDNRYNTDFIESDNQNDIYLRDALIQIASESTLVPNNSTRNRHAVATSMGAVMANLTSYQTAFASTILRRQNAKTRRGIELAKKKIKGEEGGEIRTDLLMSHWTMGAAMALTLAVTQLRHLFLTDRSQFKDDEDEDLTKLMAAFSRTGAMGRFDPFFNAWFAGKYRRDPATVSAGPVLGQFAEYFSAAQNLVTNDADTNTAERKFVRENYNAFVRPLGSASAASLPHNIPGPAGRMLDVLAIGLAMSAAHPKTRETVVAGIAGGPEIRGSGGASAYTGGSRGGRGGRGSRASR